MSARIHFELDTASGRNLSARFRLTWRRAAVSLENIDSKRPLGIPMGDTAPLKSSADVFVEGRAYPPFSGATQSHVRLEIGSVKRCFCVYGNRTARLEGETVSLGAAEAFEGIALTLSNAYGGESRGRPYPRNPIGKGFVLTGDDRRSIDLPNVEEEGDLLTPERLICAWDAWWLQPRPAIVEPALPVLFPRVALLGLSDFDAPFDARLPEVMECDVPSGFEPRLGAAAAGAWQEAPVRSRVANLTPGSDIVVEGCLPGGKERRWKAPRAPRVVLTVDGQSREVAAIPQAIRLRPEADEISITYAVEEKLHRSFILGVHSRIPITIDVEGNVEQFPTPEPVLRRVRSARQEPRGGEP